MLICPNCKDEYRADVKFCAACNVELVDPSFVNREISAADDGDVWTAETETVALFEGNLSACRELTALLSLKKIANLLKPVKEDPKAAPSGEVLGSAKIMKYAVVVPRSLLQEALLAVAGQFQAMVANEGQGVLATQVIDLEAEKISCPACGFEGPLVAGKCTECELFLGAPEAI